jgi:phenylalanyl-tRNA synthetase beta chain
MMSDCSTLAICDSSINSNMKVSYSWLQSYFDAPLLSPEALAERFTFHSFEVESIEKVGDDTVIDLDVLPNRSSDCLSLRGIARELSSILDIPLARDPFNLAGYPFFVDETLRTGDTVSLSVTPGLVRRAMKRVAFDVRVGPSPDWLVSRLASLGQRSINNVVDITNFVMLETGQPVHAFDYDKIEGEKKEIHIRLAHSGERVETLDGGVYELDQNALVISDAVHALDIAGIKGGAHSGIDEKTTRVLLSACSFDPVTIRKTSKKIKLATDASLRFQNDPSPELPAVAMHHLSRLVHEFAGARVSADVLDEYPLESILMKEVRMSPRKAASLLGTVIPNDTISSIFRRIGADVVKESDEFVVRPPWWRTDLAIAEDLVEEVGRLYGYENIDPASLPAPARAAGVHRHFYVSEKIRSALCDRGFSEVYTYTFRPEGEVELENPLRKDRAFLRASLAPGLSESLLLNARYAPLLGEHLLQIFEIGPVFTKEREYLSLGIAARTLSGKQGTAVALVNEAVSFLEEVLGCPLPGILVDGIWTVHLEDAVANLQVPQDYGQRNPAPLAQYRPFSLFPFVLRDVALWVPETTKEEAIRSLIAKEAGPLLVRIDCFDTFSKEGRISFAYHLVFQSYEKTLTDEEILPIMETLASAMLKQGWEVR